MGIPTFNNVMRFGSNTVLSAYQSYSTEKSDRAEAEANAKLIEAQASRKDREAEEAVKIGFLDQADQVRKGRREIAGQKVEYAASGVRVDSGSALEVAADKAAWSEYERQRIEYDANMESWGLKYDAALLRAEASIVRTGQSDATKATSLISKGKAAFSLK